MTARNLRERLLCAATHTEAKEELRQRILAIVNSKGPITDMALWRESAPDFLPWKFMLEELWALDNDKELRLEIIAPGNWILHSIAEQPTEIKATVQVVKKKKSRKTAKAKKPAKRKKEVPVG